MKPVSKREKLFKKNSKWNSYKKRLLIVVIIILNFCIEVVNCATWHNYRRWEYIQPHEFEVTIQPEKKEIIAGEIATFTIIVRNKTKDKLKLNFRTGQRYDLAVWHNGTQIYRWSQDKIWADTPNCLSLMPNATEKFVVSWRTVDRNYCPLPSGIYDVVGILTVLPRAIMSNTTRIELLPSRLYEGEEIKTRVNQVFELQLPIVIDLRPVDWAIEYNNNRNHVKIIKEAQKGNYKIISFYAQRPGRILIKAYAHYVFQDKTRCLERRIYSVHILGN